MLSGIENEMGKKNGSAVGGEIGGCGWRSGNADLFVGAY